MNYSVDIQLAMCQTTLDWSRAVSVVNVVHEEPQARGLRMWRTDIVAPRDRLVVEEIPQLQKDGIYILGWSSQRGHGIRIPDQATQEYHLKPAEKAILLSGSNTSGGFNVAKRPSLEQTVLCKILDANPILASYRIDEAETINFRGNHCCWAGIRDSRIIVVPPYTSKYTELSRAIGCSP